MFKFNEDEENLKCSFCGKDQDQVKKLVAGSGVYICNECIEKLWITSMNMSLVRKKPKNH